MINGLLLASVVNLNRPGRYLHWSIFTVSEANLALIVVMVVIFGAALLVRFPDHGTGQPPQASQDTPADPDAAADSRTAVVAAVRADLGDDADAAMWTSRLRRQALRLLPPGKLLPDRQPAYVASWIYVFGVATLAALGVAIASGLALALGGPDWWHTDPLGHFFNSLHLWSVEAFMAFMVIHLWGKSGSPRTNQRPRSHSRSAGSTSSMAEATMRARSRTFLATIAVAAPDTGVDRDP